MVPVGVSSADKQSRCNSKHANSAGEKDVLCLAARSGPETLGKPPPCRARMMLSRQFVSINRA